MELESLPHLSGRAQSCWAALLEKAGLAADTDMEQIVLIWDRERLIATCGRRGGLLKCIAVEPDRQGEGLAAAVVTALRQEAFRQGQRHLFLYTKPQNAAMFTPLFFYPVAQTGQVLLMEDAPGGIRRFLDGLPAPVTRGDVGAIVMNANPFTLGHRHLVQTAARECGWVYVFVLSEESAPFSAADRLAMVKAGVATLPNVTVLPTGPYLISAATFPTYFLKDREAAPTVQCRLDIQIFTQYFAAKFGIRRRYVGTEPLSPMTAQYNAALLQDLPPRGIEVRQIPRFETAEGPISASAVRRCLARGDLATARALVPESTYAYLQTHGILPQPKEVPHADSPG